MPPDVIEPAFGEGSRERHEQAALVGVRGEDVELESLLLDVDTGDDLEALPQARDHRGGAAHTRGMQQLAGR